MIQYKNASIDSQQYKQVKWLNTQFSSNGSAYINTNLFDLDGRHVKVEIDAVWSESRYYTEWNVLFCAQTYDNAPGTFQVRRHMTDGSNLVANTNDNAKISVQAHVPFHVVLEGNRLTVGQNTVITSMPSESSKSVLMIGRTNAALSNPNNRCWPGFLGRASIYEKDILMSDFIPVCSMKDNTFGYYDVVSQQFFPSASSIPFIEGVL